MLTKRFINYTEQEALEAIRQDAYALQYVKDQTEAICLEAVKQDGFALQYVEEYYQSVADLTYDLEYRLLGVADKELKNLVEDALDCTQPTTIMIDNVKYNLVRAE